MSLKVVQCCEKNKTGEGKLLNRVVKGGFTEKMALVKRREQVEGGKGKSHLDV